MKTGQEYFDMMDAETQEKFKANCIDIFDLDYYEYTISIQYISFKKFITTAFVLPWTPEGSDFWVNIIEKHS
jgi:hypothetical protein